MDIKTLGLISVPALMLGCAVEGESHFGSKTQGTHEGGHEDGVIETGGSFETNDFYGIVGFNNAPTGAVGSLLSVHRANDRCSVSASSTSPSGLSASQSPSSSNGLTCNYQLSTETLPGGATYTLNSSRSGVPMPSKAGEVLLPVGDSPEGTEVDLLTCAALTEVTFEDCDGQPTDAPANATVIGPTSFRADGNLYAVHAGAASEGDATDAAFQLQLTTGDDIYGNRLTRRVPVEHRAVCEQIETVTVDLCPVVPVELGAITGPFEVVGETLNRQSLVQVSGDANGNVRAQRSLTAPFEFPEASPEDWWRLANLPEGRFSSLRAYGYLREGYQHARFYTETLPVDVVAGDTIIPARADADGTRYPFVMAPAFIEGNIVLTHPLARREAAPLSFGALVRSADDLDANQLPVSDVSSHSHVRALSGSGSSFTSFPGDFDVATGALLSGYELPVVSVYDEARSWTDRLVLDFERAYDVSDPDQFRNGNITVTQSGDSHQLASGERATHNYDLCFSEIIMRTQLTGGDTMYAPRVSAQGSFSGENGNAVETSYEIHSSFDGFPRSSATASDLAQVHFTLPEGNYTLDPSAQVINETGAVSSSNFTATPLEVGCGQRIIVQPGLSVSTEIDSECVEGLTTSVGVDVDSSGVPVNRVWYTINGEEAADLCTDCGANPELSFEVLSADLDACENDIQVFATTTNDAGFVSSSFSLVYEVPGAQCASECREVDPPMAGACLTGTEGVDLKDRTNVMAGVEAGSFELGADATVVGDVAVDGGAFLRERSNVDGTLSVEGNLSTQNSVSTTALVENASIDLSPLPRTDVMPASGRLEVPNDSTETLSPGAYGEAIIRARSTVTLTPGVYDFNSFKIEPDVTVIVDGRVEIRSAGDVSFESRITYQMADDAELFVYSGGSSVRVHPQQTFPGTILAPDALIEVYSNVTVEGCLQGRLVRIEPDSTLIGGDTFVPDGGGSSGTDTCQVDGDCDAGESCNAGVCETSGSPLTGNLTVTSNWDAGYCANVFVINSGADVASTWQARIDLAGSSINNLWNGQSATDGGQTLVTPLNYNQSIAPGSSATFGFCANKSQPNQVPVLVSVD